MVKSTEDTRAKAKALLVDVKTYNPALLEELKADGIQPLEYLEKRVRQAEQSEKEYMKMFRERIPQDLDPLEYERELNWKRQQARELAQEELNSLLRS